MDQSVRFSTKKRRRNLLLSLFQDWSSVLVTVESDRVLDDQRCAGKQMKSSVLVFESHILFLEYHILLHINLDGDTNVKIQIQLWLEWSKRSKNGNCLTVPPSRLPMRSIGSGNMIVEFFSAEIEFNVWKIDTLYYDHMVGNIRKSWW